MESGHRPNFLEMIIVVIIFVFFLGVAVGLGLHFPLTRELRKAFDLAVEGKRIEQARSARKDETLRKIKTMLHSSRARRSNGFSEGNFG